MWCPDMPNSTFPCLMAQMGCYYHTYEIYKSGGNKSCFKEHNLGTWFWESINQLSRCKATRESINHFKAAYPIFALEEKLLL